jgi:hypothetical protein
MPGAMEAEIPDISDDEGAGESIRNLGFQAASEVVERFLGSIRPPEALGEERGPPGGQRDAFRQLRADLARAVDANLDLVRRAFDLYAGAVDRLLGTGPPAPDDEGGSHLKLPPVLPGHRAASTLWIHNTTHSESKGLRLHASDLTSPSGATISSEAYEFEPAEIDIAPANSSVPIAVGLAIGPAVPPGRYRGYVFVTNLAAEYLTIEVEVVAPVGVAREERWQDRRQAS